MNDFKNRIFTFDSIPSTHKYLKEKNNEYLSGSVIIANSQTDGIGTNGHVWYTGNNNIAMSIIYKPNCRIESLDGLTTRIAEIIQKIIFSLYNIKLKIKVPNDLLIGGKKVAGILTEVSTIGEKINYLIISIGFNLEERNFPNEIKDIATSLRIELGEDVIINRMDIINKIVYDLDNAILNIEKTI